MDFRFSFRRKKPDEQEAKRLKREGREQLRLARGIAIGLSIPLCLVAGPVSGWLIGSFLDKLFGTGFLMLTMILLGTVAGFKLTIDMLSKLTNS